MSRHLQAGTHVHACSYDGEEGCRGHCCVCLGSPPFPPQPVAPYPLPCRRRWCQSSFLGSSKPGCQGQVGSQGPPGFFGLCIQARHPERGSLQVIEQVRGTHELTPIPRLFLLCPNVSLVWTSPSPPPFLFPYFLMLPPLILTIQTAPVSPGPVRLVNSGTFLSGTISSSDLLIPLP